MATCSAGAIGRQRGTFLAGLGMGTNDVSRAPAPPNAALLGAGAAWGLFDNHAHESNVGTRGVFRVAAARQIGRAPALRARPLRIREGRRSARPRPDSPTLGSHRRLERRRCCGRICGLSFATYEVPLALV
jgi:hypothetical protein